MNLYACAGVVQNPNGNITILAANCVANSEDEAVGRVIRYMYDTYKASQGYTNYSVCATIITMDRINAVYLENHKER